MDFSGKGSPVYTGRDMLILLQLSGDVSQETDRLSDDDLFKFLTDLKKPSAGVLRKQQKMLPGGL